MSTPFARRLLALAAALALVAQPALATWSIVVINTKTGEVAVASATCLTNTNLIPDLPVVYPGLGTAAVQSARAVGETAIEMVADQGANRRSAADLGQRLQDIPIQCVVAEGKAVIERRNDRLILRGKFPKYL